MLPVCLSVGGLHAALGVLAGLLLVAAIAGAVWLRDPERPPAPGGSERPPLADPRIWRLCWASGLLYVALGSLIGFAVLFLHSDRGVSTQAAAALLALVQVIGAALRLAAGRWSDQVGTRLGPLRRLGRDRRLRALGRGARPPAGVALALVGGDAGRVRGDRG
ncbi:MAG: MFS transporter, partial [Gaiellales bacterium]